jgi:hypothetical protein
MISLEEAEKGLIDLVDMGKNTDFNSLDEKIEVYCDWMILLKLLKK